MSEEDKKKEEEEIEDLRLEVEEDKDIIEKLEEKHRQDKEEIKQQIDRQEDIDIPITRSPTEEITKIDHKALGTLIRHPYPAASPIITMLIEKVRTDTKLAIQLGTHATYLTITMLSILYGPEEAIRICEQWIRDPERMISEATRILTQTFETAAAAYNGKLEELHTFINALTAHYKILQIAKEKLIQNIRQILEKTNKILETKQRELEEWKKKLKIALTLMDKRQLAEYIKICLENNIVDTEEVKEVLLKKQKI